MFRTLYSGITPEGTKGPYIMSGIKPGQLRQGKYLTRCAIAQASCFITSFSLLNIFII